MVGYFLCVKESNAMTNVANATISINASNTVNIASPPFKASLLHSFLGSSILLFFYYITKHEYMFANYIITKQNRK